MMPIWLASLLCIWHLPLNFLVIHLRYLLRLEIAHATIIRDKGYTCFFLNELIWRGGIKLLIHQLCWLQIRLLFIYPDLPSLRTRCEYCRIAKTITFSMRPMGKTFSAKRGKKWGTFLNWLTSLTLFLLVGFHNKLIYLIYPTV